MEAGPIKVYKKMEKTNKNRVDVAKGKTKKKHTKITKTNNICRAIWVTAVD